MRGLVPRIPLSWTPCSPKRDRRDKPGDDESVGFCAVPGSPLLLLLRPQPAALRNIENDPFRILELALEIDLVLALPEIEEEGAAGVLDALLGVRNVVHHKAEVVRAGKALGVLEAGAFFAFERQQREVDDAVAQIDAGADLQILAPDPLEPEHVFIERGGFLQISHGKREMTKLGHELLLAGVECNAL